MIQHINAAQILTVNIMYDPRWSRRDDIATTRRLRVLNIDWRRCAPTRLTAIATTSGPFHARCGPDSWRTRGTRLFELFFRFRAGLGVLNVLAVAVLFVCTYHSGEGTEVEHRLAAGRGARLWRAFLCAGVGVKVCTAGRHAAGRRIDE
jgi:hypothetical protein